jgi:chemotaxis protein methyltransferase CheR
MKAKEGVYPDEMVSRMPAELVRKYFERNADANHASVRIRSQVARLVTFGRVNLMDPWPFRGPFDVVFCRNVMIYFDRETRMRLVSRIYDLLRPGGIFVIGSAETLSGENTRFKTAQPSVYVRESS